jgi:hypothetical protein
MYELGERNYAILENAIKITGNYSEAYYRAEEQLYIDEADTIFKFLNWCQEDTEHRSFGWGNYELRFKEFLKTIENTG